MKFLLVDDNEITLELQKLVLEDCGLEIITADSGKTAVELAIKNDFAMIFMDINMPDMDGFEATRQIRLAGCNTPVIALSADEVLSDDERYTRCKMNGSLLKPLEANAVIELLHSFSITTGLQSEGVKENNDDIFCYENLISLLGEEEYVYQLLEQFFKTHGNDCEILKAQIGQNDYLAARGVLHTLIGVAGNMYCTKLFECAKQLGADLRNECSDSLSQFILVWDCTINVLKSLLAELSIKYK